MQLTVATFNIRNINDRYDERRPLLLSAFAAMAPDVVGLQEVMFTDPRQDDLLAVAAPRTYTSFPGKEPVSGRFGNAILCAIGDVQASESLRLSELRQVQRILIVLPRQRTLWFANTHLHHRPLEPEVREQQARAICAWMADAPAADATIIAGDFNARPDEAAYGVMRTAGYRSASCEANGVEPDITWPSGIQSPTMDTDGDPGCLDYLWLSGNVRALHVELAANQHAAGDSTLYPSDHFALLARVEIG